MPGEAYNLGHYHEAAMSRVEADRARMREDEYRAEVAHRVRQHDTDDGDVARAAGLTLEPLSPGIGTLVHGVDLAALPDPAQRNGQPTTPKRHASAVFLRRSRTDY